MNIYTIWTGEEEPTLEAVSTTEIWVGEKRVVISWGCVDDALDAGLEMLAGYRHQQCWAYLNRTFGLQVGPVDNAFLLAVSVFGVN